MHLKTLPQPGPISAQRYHAGRCHVTRRPLHLSESVPLAQAVIDAVSTIPGFLEDRMSARLNLNGISLETMSYNLPMVSTDPARAAWYAGPFETEMVVLQETAAFFGWRDGAPLIHCHALWRSQDTPRAFGHVNADASILSTAMTIDAEIIEGQAFATALDEETNFSIFHPVPTQTPKDGCGLLVKLGPNRDVTDALTQVLRDHGIQEARLVAGVGSLVGTRFRDHGELDVPITEAALHPCIVRVDGSCSLPAHSVAPSGEIRRGFLSPGENAVGITFEILLDDCRPDPA